VDVGVIIVENKEDIDYGKLRIDCLYDIDCLDVISNDLISNDLSGCWGNYRRK
jgi:hypothetical protein